MINNRVVLPVQFSSQDTQIKGKGDLLVFKLQYDYLGESLFKKYVSNRVITSFFIKNFLFKFHL